jgi:hypothetical protein
MTESSMAGFSMGFVNGAVGVDVETDRRAAGGL